jgi:hypothetical protein
VECFEKKSDRNEGRTYKAFFRAEGDTGFDMLAGIFYLISRYEEYLPHKKDNYGRFSHESSVAFKNNFLDLPLINIWLEEFRILLAAKNPLFEKQNSAFQFQPTYDIDMAWSFLNKGLKRNAGAFLLSMASFKFRSISNRIKVLRGKMKDPFDAYEWMDQIHEHYKLRPVYFFLAARDKSRYDKNIDPDEPAFQLLIQKLARHYQVGIHPSWASGDMPALLIREKQDLEKISRQQIHSSRQHYIRFQLPQTFQRLGVIGITDEYSMGYGSINGFRASVASSFFWYDLKHEESTSLQIHPFCFMDANAYYEQKQSPEESLEEMLKYFQRIKEVNGKMITVWHNSFLGTGKEFRGWREVYQRFLESVMTA